MNLKAGNGAFYFFSHIDDCSRYSYVYSLSHHYKALDYFKHFVVMFETNYKKEIKLLRTNDGYEYLFDWLKHLCEGK